MTEKRWQRVEGVFHQAAILPSGERDAFLTQVCGGDNELRREVESLLANDRSRDDLLGPTVARTVDQLLDESRDGVDDLIGVRVGPYLVTKLIGAGGMGRVYAADDSRLGRRVALKSLPGGFTGDMGAVERFRREARTLSALNHPHICTIFDVLESGERTFIVMEYIEGAPLRGPLPDDKVLKYALQICEALEAAHRKGFIHHDLKPANIHLTETGIKLLDFGVSRVVRAHEDSTWTQGFTQAGAVMGTPAYMSPEQAEGKPVDARSDIFSLGAVLYEMIAGRRAFTGDSTARVISAVLRDDPAPLDTPPAIAQVVTRCLKKQPGQRFQTIADVRAALERISTKPAERPPSIAVLPLANLSADKEDEYFSDGLSEEIINVLAQMPALKVIARTSAFAFRGKEQDIRKIAEALGVHTILEGSVRRAGTRIRVTAQLIDAEDGSHLWSQRFDREMTDVFAVQDEIAAAIASALKMKLSGAGKSPTRRETKDKEAYQLYLRGRYLQNERSPELLRKGMEYFERVAERDPTYALPYAGLSDLLCIAGFWGREPPSTIFPRAIAAATQALMIDDSLGEAHAARALARDLFHWDWADGEIEFQRAVHLNPNSPLAHTWYSYHLSMLGRDHEAIERARIGVDIDPLSTSVNFGLVRAYFYARRYEETIAQCRRGLELGSDDFPTLFHLGESYLQMGMRDEAIASCRTAVDVSIRHPVALGALGHVLGVCGMRDEAGKIIHELIQASDSSYVPPAATAFVYLGLGLAGELLHWLEKACLDRSTILPYVVCSPAADAFRVNPAFQQVRRRMSLDP